MSVQILTGDWIEQLRTLPDRSVQCCVTSPPYWGLRDYGTAKWEGGDHQCDHLQKVGGTSSSTLGTESGGHAISPEARVKSTTRSFVPFKNLCGKCGAIRIDNQIGLEKTPEEYVAKLVAGFREVKRALKDDGTLWLNLGDSYARQAGDDSSKETDSGIKTGRTGKSDLLFKSGNNNPPIGLKPKDLVGIPWRVAFALQSDGWYLRSDIIWAKPNPMPESVTDRPTKSHEYIFLMSKSERYFYDSESIREQGSEESAARLNRADLRLKEGYIEAHQGNPPVRQRLGKEGQNSRMHVSRDANHESEHNGKQRRAMLVDRDRESHENFNDRWNGCNTRNKRSVWSVATNPFRDAHFATFPPDLIKPCVMAGTRPGDTVLDPFGGSGTTGMVAVEFGRSAILIELNPKYVELIKTRTSVTPGLAL